MLLSSLVTGNRIMELGRDWLREGLAEVDAEETLDDARHTATALTLRAAARLVDAIERSVLTTPWKGLSDGHPLSESLHAYRIARAKLDEVRADEFQAEGWKR